MRSFCSEQCSLQPRRVHAFFFISTTTTSREGEQVHGIHNLANARVSNRDVAVDVINNVVFLFLHCSLNQVFPNTLCRRDKGTGSNVFT